jgi:hypothetical protein
MAKEEIEILRGEIRERRKRKTFKVIIRTQECWMCKWTELYKSESRSKSSNKWRSFCVLFSNSPGGGFCVKNLTKKISLFLKKIFNLIFSLFKLFSNKPIFNIVITPPATPQITSLSVIIDI